MANGEHGTETGDKPERTKSPDLTRSPNPLAAPEDPSQPEKLPVDIPDAGEEPELGGSSVSLAAGDPSLMLPGPHAESREMLLSLLGQPLSRRGSGSAAIAQFATLQRLQKAGNDAKSLTTGLDVLAVGKGVALLRNPAYVAALACRGDLGQYWNHRVECAVANLAADAVSSDADRVLQVLGPGLAQKAFLLEEALTQWATLRADGAPLDALTKQAEAVSQALTAMNDALTPKDMGTGEGTGEGTGVTGKDGTVDARGRQLGVLREYVVRIGGELARQVAEHLARQEGAALAGQAVPIAPRSDAIAFALREGTARYVAATTGVKNFPATVERSLKESPGVDKLVSGTAKAAAKDLDAALADYAVKKKAGQPASAPLQAVKASAQAMTDALRAIRSGKSVAEKTQEVAASLGLIVACELEKIIAAEPAEGRRLLDEIAKTLRRQVAPEALIVVKDSSTLSSYWNDQLDTARKAVKATDPDDAARLDERLAPRGELAEALQAFLASAADANAKSDPDAYAACGWRVARTIARYRSAVLLVLGQTPESRPLLRALDNIALTVAWTAKGVAGLFKI